MNINEICSNTDWSSNTQQTFWDLLGKTKKKIYYIEKKADKIFYWGDKSKDSLNAALNLYEYLLSNFNHEEDKLCEIKYKISKVYSESGDNSQSIKTLEDIVEKNSSYVDIENVYLQLAYLYLNINNLSGCTKYQKLFKSKIKSNKQDVLAWLLTEIGRKTDDFEQSDKQWIKFYRKNKINGYDEIEILAGEELSPKNPDEAADRLFAELASLCPSLNQYSLQSLIELDNVIWSLKTEIENDKYYIITYDIKYPNYKNYNQFVIVDIGAYLGKWIIKNSKSSWISGEKILNFRIKKDSLIIDPFKYAYDFAYLKHRLSVEIYNELMLLM